MDEFTQYLLGLGASPFDTNAGVNLPAAQATSPIITNNTTGTTSVSPSFLQQIGSFLSSAAPIASAIVPAVTGKPATAATGTAAKTATGTAVSSILGSPLILIGLIGGGILLVFLLFRGRGRG